jgi:hypothetical protein
LSIALDDISALHPRPCTAKTSSVIRDCSIPKRAIEVCRVATEQFTRLCRHGFTDAFRG